MTILTGDDLVNAYQSAGYDYSKHQKYADDLKNLKIDLNEFEILPVGALREHGDYYVDHLLNVLNNPSKWRGLAVLQSEVLTLRPKKLTGEGLLRLCRDLGLRLDALKEEKYRSFELDLTQWRPIAVGADRKAEHHVLAVFNHLKGGVSLAKAEILPLNSKGTSPVVTHDMYLHLEKRSTETLQWEAAPVPTKPERWICGHGKDPGDTFCVVCIHFTGRVTELKKT